MSLLGEMGQEFLQQRKDLQIQLIGMVSRFAFQRHSLVQVKVKNNRQNFF